jgi:histidyl-tRNA synthetase
LKGLLADSEIGLKGIDEIEYMFRIIGKSDLSTASCELDITLARGLNYYTGAIFEVKANVGTLTSSICGGGRYDDLTGIFGLPNMSGVGISFGADRIYDVLNELNLYPESVAASTKLLFVTFGEKEQEYCLPLLARVRKAGINSEIYPDANAKMKKQMGYADDKKTPFVVIVGGDEMESGMLSLKNMGTGEQEKLGIESIIKKLK